jgi:hypothetical protein
MCRDVGKVGGCPRCGRVLNLKSTDKIHISAKTAEMSGIPKHYLTNTWDSTILKKDHEQYCDDVDFNAYVNNLDACYKGLCEGRLPKISALIASPFGYGKTTWAYNCLLQAKANGFTIAPLVDTAQVRRLLLIATERPEWHNMINGCNYNDFVNADLMIVCISTGPEYVYAYETIVNLVNMRSRIGKATLFLSNYSIRELIGQDKKMMLIKLLNGGTNVDPLKFLKKMEFVEYEVK